MGRSPLYEFAYFLYRNERHSDLQILLEKFLLQSKNKDLWQLYIECLKRNTFQMDSLSNETKVIEEVTSAYETALEHFMYNPDITFIFTDYLNYLKMNFSPSLIVDKIRSAYHLILKQAIIKQDKILSDYERFENELNRTSAKAILEKLNVSKLPKKLSLKFNMNEEFISQITVLNCQTLFEFFTGDEEKKAINLILKDVFYWNEELWYEIVDISLRKKNLIDEAIFVNTICQLRHQDVVLDLSSGIFCIPKTITNNNLFFILMGAYFRCAQIYDFIFNQRAHEKLEKILQLDKNARFTLMDLQLSFLQLKRRQKDLVFIHLLTQQSKTMSIEQITTLFAAIVDLIGPLVFYHFARFLYFNTQNIQHYLNIMLLGIKLSSNLESLEKMEEKEDLPIFTRVLQQYVIQFLFLQSKIELAKRFEGIFGLSDQKTAFRFQTFQNNNNFQFDDANIDMTAFYYYSKLKYDEFEIKFERNADFVNLISFDILKPMRHEYILSILEEADVPNWVGECEFKISLFEIKQVLSSLKD